jgi:predicted transcriptional regulator
MAKLLYNETRRKLIEYALLDRNLTKKYGMSFEEFREKKMIEKLGYTWEVEKDH